MYYFKLLNLLDRHKGATLLMVVLVPALLATTIVVSSTNRVCGLSKRGRMIQVAVDLGRGMESFRSRHGRYYPLTSTPEVYDPNNAEQVRRWANLLEFSPGADNMVITVCAGERGERPSHLCEQAAPPSAHEQWFAVVVQMDMDDDGVREATVVYSNSGEDPRGWRTLPLR